MYLLGCRSCHPCCRSQRVNGAREQGLQLGGTDGFLGGFGQCLFFTPGLFISFIQPPARLSRQRLVLLSRCSHASRALAQTPGCPSGQDHPSITHSAGGPGASPCMLPTAPSPCNQAMGQVCRTQASGPEPPIRDSPVSPRPGRQHAEKGGGGSTGIFLSVINVHLDSHWWVPYNLRESPHAAARGAAS